MASRRHTGDRRRRILANAEQAGDEQAAAEAGVSVATLRKWRGDPEPEQPDTPAEPQADAIAGDSAPTTDALLDDIGKMRASRDDAMRVVALAIAKTRALLDRNQASEARNASASADMLSKRAIEWDRLIIEAEDRRAQQTAQLARDQADVLVERTRRLLDALKVPVGDESVRSVVAAALRGDELAVAEVELARGALRDVFTDEIRETIEAAARADAPHEQRALPAPAGPHPDGRESDEREPMAGPVRRVRASRERRRKRERERVEVVSGEVVDERKGWGPVGRGQGAVEEAANRGRSLMRIDEDGNPVNPERGRAPWDE
jgi:hypothetical protein